MKTKLFDLSKNYYYVVDTSYIVFCAAAAAFKDYVYQNDIMKSDLSPDFDPTIDPDFNAILTERFINRVTAPIKAQTPFTFDMSKFIFTLDCSRSNIWRRDFYPEYKMNRDQADHSKDQFNLGKVFQYVYEHVIPNFCDETGSVAVRSSCAESDDIIAVLVDKLCKENKNNFVIILSSDRDMVQLYNDQVMIIANQNEIREPKKELEAMSRTQRN